MPWDAKGGIGFSGGSDVAPPEPGFLQRPAGEADFLCQLIAGISRIKTFRHATLSQLERGLRDDVTTETAKRLARALSVSVDSLIGMYEEEEEPPARVPSPALPQRKPASPS